MALVSMSRRSSQGMRARAARSDALRVHDARDARRTAGVEDASGAAELSGFRRVASDVRKVRELSERPRLGMRWVHPVSELGATGEQRAGAVSVVRHGQFTGQGHEQLS